MSNIIMTQYKDDYLLIFGGGKNVGTLDSGLKIDIYKIYQAQNQVINGPGLYPRDSVDILELKEYEMDSVTPGVCLNWKKSDADRTEFLIFSDFEDKLWTCAVTMIS
jgi:hypothetical protein